MVITFACLIIFYSAVQTRTHILVMKITGELDGASWFKVFTWMLPHAWQPKLDGSVIIKQIDSDNPNLVLWDTPGGDFWGRSTDRKILEVCFLKMKGGCYQNDIVSVTNEDVVLDVGSHLGTFTRAALSHGAKLVVAFECEPTNLTCFRKTFKRELAEHRVILIDAAVWEEPGVLSFEISSKNSASGKVSHKSGSLVVRAVTIDDTVEELELSQIDFIKMDIEGSERYALKGAQKTLSNFTPSMALCIVHNEDDGQIIPEMVLAMQPTYNVRKTIGYAYFFR